MYGIFSNKGLLQGDFFSEIGAIAVMAERYAGDDAHVAVVCPDHEDQEYDSCESCDTEEDEDSDE